MLIPQPVKVLFDHLNLPSAFDGQRVTDGFPPTSALPQNPPVGNLKVKPKLLTMAQKRPVRSGSAGISSHPLPIPSIAFLPHTILKLREQALSPPSAWSDLPELGLT